MGTSRPSFRNSATTSTYTLFMPTPHYKISIALGDAGILRIYPFNSNCLILENADDVDFTPINSPHNSPLYLHFYYICTQETKNV